MHDWWFADAGRWKDSFGSGESRGRSDAHCGATRPRRRRHGREEMTTVKTAMDASELLEIEDRWGAHNYHPLPIVVERAQGVWVYDVAGKRYLDCLSAYSALNQGHGHPKILAAFQEQAQRVTLTSRAFRNDQLPLFCKELAELTGLDIVLPMNSGAEAVETA